MPEGAVSLPAVLSTDDRPVPGALVAFVRFGPNRAYNRLCQRSIRFVLEDAMRRLFLPLALVALTASLVAQTPHTGLPIAQQDLLHSKVYWAS